ncbi:hypothetical protein CTEN210_12755 [Chaetoceros tenuissimus]|uniref:Exportin-4 n=1 Tax=Chaetoceros tenuissimus TaxID=426638 RepID=A0AAD3D591_9STRA|nr:hypothetical protein CTEN210_12755 [Chaetoceros tenuissimus]
MTSLQASNELLSFLSSGSLNEYHTNLQSLRDNGDPSFLFIRTILELCHNCSSPQYMELLFHSILGFRHVVLYRWNSFSDSFKSTARDFILGLGLGWNTTESMNKTCSNACLGTAAAFYKRGWRENCKNSKVSPQEEMLIAQMSQHSSFCNTSRETLFNMCQQTLLQALNAPSPSSVSTATMSTLFLKNLIGEFSGGNTAASYNCSLDFHKSSHVAFEPHLSGILQYSFEGLSSLIPKLSSGEYVELADAIVNLTIDVLSWEFGSLGGKWGRTGGTGLVRPPESWREYLIRPDFLGAIFQVYVKLRNSSQKLNHSLRQLLILLSSITGSVFENKSQKKDYSQFMMEGCISVLGLLMTELSGQSNEYLESETIDMCCMITRLVENFRIEGLSQLASFTSLLQAIASLGNVLLKTFVEELKAVEGDVECLENGEWKNEAIGMLLEAICLLCEDHWLISIRGGNAQDAAKSALATALAPLYHSYVSCRIEMAKMEEYYLTANAADLDEVREDIASVQMQEEMTSACSLGRVNLASSLQCLSSLFQTCMPQLQNLFSTDGQSDVSPEAAALLEEARLLVMCACHLLTDDSSGESPLIPEAIINTCSPPTDSPHTFKTGSVDYAASTMAISQIVSTLMGLAEFQASKIANNPYNPHLSPLLAKTLLWFFTRWVPAYVLPSSGEYGYSSGGATGHAPDSILATWSTPEASSQVLSFCSTLCLHYLTCWPQEIQVLEGCAELLLAIAKRGRDMRVMLMTTPSMEHLCNLHVHTACQIHASSQELVPVANLSKEMMVGYKRIPYKHRARMLKSMLIASSEINDAKSESMFATLLESVKNAFGTLIHALQTKKVKIQDVFTLEMICLCVELFGGIARSSEMSHPERIPLFVTECLPQLSGLMTYYAEDITICTILLDFFRDYTEQFIAMLDREQCLVVFQASAELLKAYSQHHCNQRVIHKTISKSTEEALEEEQSYNDVLCAIQLLNNIGAKDFIDSFSSERNGQKGVDSNEVIQVVFFGLQQILPLMTKGLLHFPTLTKQYFNLVGFMIDTYPSKIGMLPYELFKGLLDSMLFGINHVDPFVSKSSLQGIAALAKEHLENSSLQHYLNQNPQMFDECSQKLLEEVIFQTIIWDRMDPAAYCLLPLAAVDMNRFAAVVNGIAQKLDAVKQQRMQDAFARLMQPDVIAKVSKGNYGGRLNKMRFRKDFEVFVKDIHSAVLIF